MDNYTESFTRYCKSYNFGHRWLQKYFDEPVDVEEKIDGSQFSFCLNEDGVIQFRSRNRVFGEHDVHDLFGNTVDYILSVRELLVPGWTYRGEAMKGQKHNTLRYDRAPAGNLVLFDIATGDSMYTPHSAIFTEAERLGFECVPLLDNNVRITNLDQARAYLKEQSVLGGTFIEGVVFKRRHKPLFNDRDNMIIAKLVSEQFREAHSHEYVGEPKNKKDLLELIVEQYSTEQRWDKAIQHLAESNDLVYEPKDIAKLIKEIQRDVLEDHAEEIKNKLLSAVRKKLERGLVRGFPEYYKRFLEERQF